jgi:drug/metabolite transporter (DMT)-like permease
MRSGSYASSEIGKQGERMKQVPFRAFPVRPFKPLTSSERHQGIDRRAYLAAGFTVVLWASAFPGIRAALQNYTPAHVALIRYVTASLVLVVYALFARIRLPRFRDLPGFALLGLIGIAFYNVALNTGEIHVPSAEASFLVASAPIFMAVEAMPFLGERLRIWGWVGIAVSCGGIALITLSQNASFHLDLWALLVLMAAVAQSLYSVGQKPFLTRYTALECTAYALWAGTLFLLIFSPGLLEELRTAPLHVTLAATYLGIFPGALGYVSWAYALSRLPASTAASFLYLVPIVASGIAWVWLGEVPALFALLGGVFVLAGVILVNTRGRKGTR